MLSPDSIKQTFDIAGYSVMGLVGMFSAWQRVRGSIQTQSEAAHGRGNKGKGGLTPMERLKQMEQNLVWLRNRQDELQQESATQHSSVLKQQSAMFDLLVQQRSVLDKILAKTIGLV